MSSEGLREIGMIDPAPLPHGDPAFSKIEILPNREIEIERAEVAVPHSDIVIWDLGSIGGLVGGGGVG